MFQFPTNGLIPGGRALTQLTAEELAILDSPDLANWFSTRSLDGSRSRLCFRDLVNGKLWKSQGQGKLGADLNDIATYGGDKPTSNDEQMRLVIDSALPSSYSVYYLGRLVTGGGNDYVLTTEQAAADRVYHYINNVGSVAVDHGTTYGSLTSGTGITSGDEFVLAITYDDDTNLTAVYHNSLTVKTGPTSGITGIPSGFTQTALLGHDATCGDVELSDVIITRTPDHLSIYNERRNAILSYLGTRGNVTFT